MNPCNNNQEKTEEEEEEGIVEKMEKLSPSTSSSSIIGVRPPTTSPAYLVFHHSIAERSQTNFDEDYWNKRIPGMHGSILMKTMMEAQGWIIEFRETFLSLSDKTCSVKNIAEMHDMTGWASSHGWLVMTDENSTGCFLLNPVTMEKVELPPLMYDDYNACVLTSSPHTPNCVVMFFIKYKLYCIFCRPGQEKWTRQDLKVPGVSSDPNFSIITAVTSCKDNIYITYLDGNGIAVLDTTSDKSNVGGGLFTIRRAIMKKHHEFPKHPSCAQAVASYLVESCEEVFMVRKHYKGISKHVFGFSVFRLDISTMDWEHMTNLGDDRVFLLGLTCSSSVSASAVGVNENCICFFDLKDRNLYKFRMDEESISIFLPFPYVRMRRKQPYWMLPLV